MTLVRSEIDSLAKKGWTSEKAKEILARDLPIGSMISTVISYVESQLKVPYLEFSILNPHFNQVIPAFSLLSIDVVNYTSADKAVTCFIDYPKLTEYKVRFIQFAFWFRDDKLTLINVVNRDSII